MLIPCQLPLALASVLRKIESDLIITGCQAVDGDTAQVGPQIADLLGLLQISYGSSIQTQDGKIFTVKRAIEDGYQELAVSSPCLFTFAVFCK